MGSIPGKAKGYGNNSTARNVFKCTFSQALSAAVKYEGWDNSETFPVVDSAGSTVAGKLFIGTTGNSNKPMISLVDTTNAAPSSDWKPASATAGEANPNRLKGATNYVEQDGAIRALGEAITWNMVVELPYDLATSDNMAHLLQLRYTYTGTAPSLTWAYNDDVAGTEESPDWTTLTVGTHGIRHSASGASSPNYYANIPASGTEDTAEGHITT